MATACPRCGAPAVERDKCTQCGVVASVYAAALEKMRRPPTPPSSGPRASAPPAAAAVPAATPYAQPSPSAQYSASGSGGSATAVMTAPPAAATAGAASAVTRRLTFHGSGGTLFGIYVVNILLTIATLGIYRFWGRVKVRRFMLSQT